ncbi:hypothetical protein TCAL_07352 [Tigriopus californicus]|uniref:C2H2-type domain-containing protein n=1 Tax=Tigriopus californicus TaxID=6832 RepID=A0A553NXI9_TIGCA|nr:hypothetical protein TCAL_07352 [Tigriopus californicus]|eukprot:TCALIF_07352-PA protein Name:"Similar to Rest RE1-silencing transcription factor (Mus musculus)" AED:0.11 eAED:0.11 QI:0/-1/0/1/-1/1/1/0/233
MSGLTLGHALPLRPPCVPLPNKPVPMESLGGAGDTLPPPPAESPPPGSEGSPTGTPKNKIDPHWASLPVTDQCAYCSYITDRKDRMRRHIRTVHYKDKPFQCAFCPHTFGRKDKMKRHEMTVHHAHKPIQCPQCNMTFARKDKMLTHMNRSHAVTLIGHVDPGSGNTGAAEPVKGGSHTGKSRSNNHPPPQPPTAQFPPNGLNLAFSPLGHVQVGPPLDIKPVFSMSTPSRLV